MFTILLPILWIFLSSDLVGMFVGELTMIPIGFGLDVWLFREPRKMTVQEFLAVAGRTPRRSPKSVQ